LCPAAVKALSMDILMEVSFAVGWRMKWRRFSVASTIAMLKSVVYREHRLVMWSCREVGWERYTNSYLLSLFLCSC
jgi:hypothetical protein